MPERKAAAASEPGAGSSLPERATKTRADADAPPSSQPPSFAPGDVLAARYCIRRFILKEHAHMIGKLNAVVAYRYTHKVLVTDGPPREVGIHDLLRLPMDLRMGWPPHRGSGGSPCE